MDETTCNSVGPFLCKPAVTMGPHCVTKEESMDLMFKHSFEDHLHNYENDPDAALKKARQILFNSMKIDTKYSCLPIDTYVEPMSPQDQNDYYIKCGLEMAIPTVEKALVNAGLGILDINAVVFTSQNPYPFPAFTNNLLNAMGFHEDCVQIPTNTMGCAGSSFAINSACNFLSNKPDENVLVLCLELCSLGFRPNKSGMMWLLTTALFGDGCAAIVVRGGMKKERICQGNESEWDYKGLKFVYGKQRRVPDTTRAAYFEYNPEGFYFIMNKELTNIVKNNAPRFCMNLTREAFGKSPKDLKVNLIHPGGAKMIADIGVALVLGGTLSETLAYEGMANGGNTASVSVIDMLARVWDKLVADDELIIVGMGPGFLMHGVALSVLDMKIN